MTDEDGRKREMGRECLEAWSRGRSECEGVERLLSARNGTHFEGFRS